DSPGRAEGRQVSDRLEGVGLPGAVGADEQVHARVRAPFETAIGAEIGQFQPSDMHGRLDANRHEEIDEVGAVASVDHARPDTVDHLAPAAPAFHWPVPARHVAGVRGYTVPLLL